MLRAVEGGQRCERGHVAHIFGARTCTQRTEQTQTGVGRVPGPGPVQMRGVQGCVVAGKLCKLKSGISVALTCCLCLSLFRTLYMRSPTHSLLPSLPASLVCVCRLSVLTNVLLAPATTTTTATLLQVFPFAKIMRKRKRQKENHN